jgi:hypothetical protein
MSVGSAMSVSDIITYLFNKRCPLSTEAVTKYFLIQYAIASIILSIIIILNALDSGQWSLTYKQNLLTSSMTSLVLVIKFGLVPVYI